MKKYTTSEGKWFLADGNENACWITDGKKIVKIEMKEDWNGNSEELSKDIIYYNNMVTVDFFPEESDNKAFFAVKVNDVTDITCCLPGWEKFQDEEFLQHENENDGESYKAQHPRYTNYEVFDLQEGASEC